MQVNFGGLIPLDLPPRLLSRKKVRGKTGKLEVFEVLY
jgi:hypothetical protein